MNAKLLPYVELGAVMAVRCDEVFVDVGILLLSFCLRLFMLFLLRLFVQSFLMLGSLPVLASLSACLRWHGRGHSLRRSAVCFHGARSQIVEARRRFGRLHDIFSRLLDPVRQERRLQQTAKSL